MELISLDAVRKRKAQSLQHALRQACSIYNTVPANKLNKFCVHCKFQGTANCPRREASGLTVILPFIARQRKSLA